jgi:hypothetical protein
MVPRPRDVGPKLDHFSGAEWLRMATETIADGTSSAGPAKDLNAQGEQRDGAHTHDQDRQCHGVVVQPMSALYTHEGTSP